MVPYDQSEKPNKKTPRPSPRPFEPFPVELLPKTLRNFVLEVSKSIPCDPSYVALPVLAVVASAIGTSHRVLVKNGWTEPATLWCVIVGDSGTQKSPVIDLAVEPMRWIEGQFDREFKNNKSKYDLEFSNYKSRKKAADSDKNSFSEPPPKEPICKRAVISDATIEAVAQVLWTNPKGVLVARDELSAWFSSFTRHSKSSDLPHWLELHGCKPLTIDRKTGDQKTMRIPLATVSIAGGIQPSILARHMTQEARESGLMARFLLAMPPKTVKKFTATNLSEAAKQAYKDIIVGLSKLENRFVDGEPTSIDVGLSPEAAGLFASHVNTWGERSFAAEHDEAAVLAKLEGAAARFALIFHMIKVVEGQAQADQLIGPDCVNAGVSLSSWFANETVRCYDYFSKTEDERLIADLCFLIAKKKGSMTVRDLQRESHQKYPNREVAKKALDRVAAANYGKWVKDPGPNGAYRLTLNSHFEEFEFDVEDSEAPLIITPKDAQDTEKRPIASGDGPSQVSSVDVSKCRDKIDSWESSSEPTTERFDDGFDDGKTGPVSDAEEEARPRPDLGHPQPPRH